VVAVLIFKPPRNRIYTKKKYYKVEFCERIKRKREVYSKGDAYQELENFEDRNDFYNQD
jgi:hypothetical protein